MIFEAITYALIQFIAYVLLVMNYRYVAAANVRGSVLTDGLYASFQFFVIRRIATSEDSLPGFIGYVTGSMLGTVFGIWLSKRTAK